MINKIMIIWCVFCLIIIDKKEMDYAWNEIDKGDVLSWSRHITGQDVNDLTSWDEFKSVAVIYGRSEKACGDTRLDDEIWAVVKRTNGTYIEQFQALDWGEDDDYCWFVDCGGKTQDIWHPAIKAVAGVEGTYPILQVADGTFAAQQSDPGLTHTTAISDVTDLQNMKDDMAGNYYLTGDIDASATSGWNSGAGFEPIGASLTPFTGTLDGCGYSISNLFINRPITSYVGLFGKIEDATLANITISDCNITGRGYSLGSIIGAAESNLSTCDIYNCHTSGNVTAAYTDTTSPDIGGFVGTAAGGEGFEITFYDCTTSCNVDTTVGTVRFYSIGGFVGSADCYSKYYNCRSSGTVTAKGTKDIYVGGFAGYDDGTTLDEVIFQDCSTTSDVSGYYDVGGFIGQTRAITCIRCSARGTTTAAAGNAGAFFGLAAGTAYSRYVDCYGWGDAEDTAGWGEVGGFGGYVSSATAFTNVYSIGTVSGGHVGGLLGYDPDSTITSCFWDTEASGESTSDGGEGHVTVWMQTQSNYESAGWDFSTVWEMTSYQAGVDAVPGYTETIEVGYQANKVCVYADGIPMGVYDVNSVDSNDILGFDEDDYDVVIAGLNYYSIYESFPLIPAGYHSSIKDVKIDFYESMGCHVGVDLDNCIDWIFSYDDFATAIDPMTEIKNAPFVWGSTREPVIYLYEWEPIPLTIRSIYTSINLTIE